VHAGDGKQGWIRGKCRWRLRQWAHRGCMAGCIPMHVRRVKAAVQGGTAGEDSGGFGKGGGGRDTAGQRTMIPAVTRGAVQVAVSRLLDADSKLSGTAHTPVPMLTRRAWGLVVNSDPAAYTSKVLSAEPAMENQFATGVKPLRYWKRVADTSDSTLPIRFRATLRETGRGEGAQPRWGDGEPADSTRGPTTAGPHGRSVASNRDVTFTNTRGRRVGCGRVGGGGGGRQRAAATCMDGGQPALPLHSRHRHVHVKRHRRRRGPHHDLRIRRVVFDLLGGGAAHGTGGWGARGRQVGPQRPKRGHTPPQKKALPPPQHPHACSGKGTPIEPNSKRKPLHYSASYCRIPEQRPCRSTRPSRPAQHAGGTPAHCDMKGADRPRRPQPCNGIAHRHGDRTPGQARTPGAATSRLT
jgi:hypothetical protein